VACEEQAPLASAPVRPFVGRARELHQVQRRFEGALSGSGRLVFVTLLGPSDSTQVADVLRRHAPSWYAQLPAAR
jgi:hypothetical protein